MFNKKVKSRIVFLGLSFFSKQVPSTYVIISVLLILTIFSLIKRKYYWIKYFCLSSGLFILSLLFFGIIQGISLSSFLDIYVFYTQTIREQRFDNFIFTYRGTIDHFKFIYIAIIPFIFVNF